MVAQHVSVDFIFQMIESVKECPMVVSDIWEENVSTVWLTISWKEETAKLKDVFNMKEIPAKLVIKNTIKSEMAAILKTAMTGSMINA